jgi:hypothetical protein
MPASFLLTLTAVDRGARALVISELHAPCSIEPRPAPASPAGAGFFSSVTTQSSFSTLTKTRG